MLRTLAQNLTLPSETGTTIIRGPATRFLDLGDVIDVALRYIFAFAGIGLLLMIIFAGFSMLTAAGDSKKLDAGKSRLTNAIVGFLIILIAYWVTQIAGTILGYQQITDIFR